jgi:hypothetical protein
MPGPDAPDSLPAVVARHAAAAPERPWLFAPRGGDWGWLAWGDAVRRIGAMAGTLAAADLPTGAAVAFLDVPRPETICLDLALQAAGLTAVPIARDVAFGTHAALTAVLQANGCVGWVGIRGEQGPELPAGVTGLRVPWELSSYPNSFSAAKTDLSHFGLLAAAARLAAELPPDRRLGRSRREVLVFGGRLDDRDDRVLLTWALLAGAAVLLEPEPAAVIPTAVWARVTLFHGDAARLAALRRAVEQEREPLGARLLRRFGRRRSIPQRPLGRLHTLVATGATPLPAPECAFWTERGVTIVRLPH